MNLEKEKTLQPCDELTRLQKKKLLHLEQQGGQCSAITLHVDMDDGHSCTIDQFGRVVWGRSDGKTLTVENSTITIIEEEYVSLKHINVVNGCLRVKMKNGSTVTYGGGGHVVVGDVYRNNASS